MGKLRAAFASSNNAYIDEHFGSAQYFQIYDIDEKEAEYVEERRINPLCKGHCEGGFEAAYNLLKDTDAIFVLRIGESAAGYMIQHGKRVFEAHGFIENIVNELIGDGFAKDSDTDNDNENVVLASGGADQLAGDEGQAYRKEAV
ncbi:NifB/NifX family molybdenum-iron cluster-binding protein [Butyrivibrio fibrisolvens]|uniref:NifB/NifX family molybdenum-iron cluster-binding protein n=1 Tax=Butyrivibrio fibrisolvens TaxID=831 RepID=UPI000414036D|nr:NifB/NifX family molybdenum-iron cluster-binding protein [Butyrivibrio fibrisolvens]